MYGDQMQNDEYYDEGGSYYDQEDSEKKLFAIQDSLKVGNVVVIGVIPDADFGIALTYEGDEEQEANGPRPLQLNVSIDGMVKALTFDGSKIRSTQGKFNPRLNEGNEFRIQMNELFFEILVDDKKIIEINRINDVGPIVNAHLWGNAQFTALEFIDMIKKGDVYEDDSADTYTPNQVNGTPQKDQPFRRMDSRRSSRNFKKGIPYRASVTLGANSPVINQPDKYAPTEPLQTFTNNPASPSEVYLPPTNNNQPGYARSDPAPSIPIDPIGGGGGDQYDAYNSRDPYNQDPLAQPTRNEPQRRYDDGPAYDKPPQSRPSDPYYPPPVATSHPVDKSEGCCRGKCTLV